MSEMFDCGDGQGWCEVCGEGLYSYPCMHTADEVREHFRRCAEAQAVATCIRAEARAEGYAQAERDIAGWLRHVCLERGSARAMADCIEGGEHRPVDGSDSDD